MENYSLYRGARQAAQDYQERLVRRMGEDFNGVAQSEWNRDHWWIWAAQRAVQHLTGEKFCVELGREQFASVTSETPDRVRLVEEFHNLLRTIESGTFEKYDDATAARERWADIINRLLD